MFILKGPKKKRKIKKNGRTYNKLLALGYNYNPKGKKLIYTYQLF